MGKLKRLSFILIVILLMPLSGDRSKASCNIDVFSEMIKISNSQVIENGIKVEYYTNEKAEDECKRVLSNLILDKMVIEETTKNEASFYIKFTSEYISGYIESIKSGKENQMVVFLSEKSNENDLKHLNEKIKGAIKNNTNKAKVYQYIKASLNDNNFDSLNCKLLKKLKTSGAENIESLDITNGYYTVSNTKKFNPQINNGKLIDFSYALCKYYSGSYILLGTPEVIVSF